MKTLLPTIGALMLSGCGSALSMREDHSVQNDLTKAKTNCSFIPKIYSGVAYDFCHINASSAGNDTSGAMLQLVLIDTAFSGAIDTVLLPYGVYRQVTEGSIRLD
ncbi:YceK/YidQ family lipoprotein [Pseudomonas sp. NPDC007930]|uniref:YceK/YidQ family lipoprotein n=1 Tax=Pseudomonas sp. NPDC007930 TaxID=3364417 RepID=UPI0036EF021A